MKWLWSCRCQRCGKEIADTDKQALEFKRGGWVYLGHNRGYICDECADELAEADAIDWRRLVQRLISELSLAEAGQGNGAELNAAIAEARAALGDGRPQ